MYVYVCICDTQAIAKYPGGTPRRWQVITSLLQKRASTSSFKSQKQVIQKARQLELRSMGYRTAAAAPKPKPKPKLKTTTSAAASSSTASSSGSINGVAGGSSAVKPEKKENKPSTPAKPGGEEWSSEQQTALETALREVKKADCEKQGKDRWEEIAARVKGKTRKECIQRFKHIRQMIKQNKALGTSKR